MMNYIQDLFFEGEKIGQAEFTRDFNFEHLYLMEAILVDPEYRKLHDFEKEMLLKKELPIPTVIPDLGVKFSSVLCDDYVRIITQLYVYGSRFALREKLHNTDLSYFVDRFNRYTIKDII